MPTRVDLRGATEASLAGCEPLLRAPHVFMVQIFSESLSELSATVEFRLSQQWPPELRSRDVWCALEASCLRELLELERRIARALGQPWSGVLFTVERARPLPVPLPVPPPS